MSKNSKLIEKIKKSLSSTASALKCSRDVYKQLRRDFADQKLEIDALKEECAAAGQAFGAVRAENAILKTRIRVLKRRTNFKAERKLCSVLDLEVSCHGFTRRVGAEHLHTDG